MSSCMDKKQYEMSYWKQYMLLEHEFELTIPYVELVQSNYSTYSTVFLKLLLEIGSEVDNVLREMCSWTGRSDISAYAQFVLSNYPCITDQMVLVQNCSLSLTPFAGWNTDQPSQSLVFWDAYNHVKHDRIAHFCKASLHNVICALAALFLLEMYRLRKLYNVEPNAYNSLPDTESKLFILSSWEQRIRLSKAKIPYSLIDDDNNGMHIL